MFSRPSLRLASLLAFVFGIGACSGSKSDGSNEPEAETAAEPSSDVGQADEPALGGTGPIGKELPAELVAELRLAGADQNGRLLTLAAGFMATAECSDCGAPSYLWFLAVRCEDTRHCEVLTEQCEGRISREDDSYTLEFRPVEGVDAQVCDGYSGSFERP